MKRKNLIHILLALRILLCGCGRKKDKIPENPEIHIVENGNEVVVEVAVHQESGLLRITIQEENNLENVVYDGNTFPSDGTVSRMDSRRGFCGFLSVQYDLNWS